VQGRDVHTGTAKDEMINALQVLIDFHDALPAHDRPELTDGREGFYHLQHLGGTVEEAESGYIIRDYEDDAFEGRKQRMRDIAARMNAGFGQDRVRVELHDQYYNMKRVLEQNMAPVHLARAAMDELGIPVDIMAVRGGTDGSKISFLGIPTPNLFAGGENMHGRFEYVPLESMEKGVDLVIRIAEMTAR